MNKDFNFAVDNANDAHLFYYQGIKVKEACIKYTKNAGENKQIYENFSAATSRLSEIRVLLKAQIKHSENLLNQARKIEKEIVDSETYYIKRFPKFKKHFADIIKSIYPNVIDRIRGDIIYINKISQTDLKFVEKITNTTRKFQNKLSTIICQGCLSLTQMDRLIDKARSSLSMILLHIAINDDLLKKAQVCRQQTSTGKNTTIGNKPSIGTDYDAGGLKIKGKKRLKTGEVTKYTATDSLGKKYERGTQWLSSDESVLIIDQNGNASGFKNGKVIIIAKKDGNTAYINVTITSDSGFSEIGQVEKTGVNNDQAIREAQKDTEIARRMSREGQIGLSDKTIKRWVQNLKNKQLASVQQDIEEMNLLRNKLIKDAANYTTKQIKRRQKQLSASPRTIPGLNKNIYKKFYPGTYKKWWKSVSQSGSEKSGKSTDGGSDSLTDSIELMNKGIIDEEKGIFYTVGDPGSNPSNPNDPSGLNPGTSNNSGNGNWSYDTRGLKNRKVWGAIHYLNKIGPNAYVIRKYYEAPLTPKLYTIIFGPNTFMACREWLFKKGYW